ncbi:MAG: DNA mismatch repair protein MutS [Chlamydia sp.]
MSLDSTKTTPMMAQWARCKSESEGSLLLFRLGDFYEAFHEDAVTIAQLLDLTLTKRQEIPMCGMPWHASESYIDRLIQKGFSVAIAEQTEEIVSEKSGKIAFDRKIVRIQSPGTTISQALLQENAFHFIAALSDDRKNGLGLALIDMSTGLFQALQSKSEKEKDELILALIQRRPKEIVFSRQFSKQNQELITYLETHLSFRKTIIDNWFFDPLLAYEVLKNHFQIQTLEPFGMHVKPLAIAASGALLCFIRDTLFHNIAHLKSIEYIQTLTKMQIDVATMKSLDLFEVESKRHDAKSLFSILNQAKTPMGARLLRSWLLQPLIDIETIAERQDLIQTCRDAIVAKGDSLYAKIAEGLSSIRDLERLTQKIVTQTVSPRDIRSLAASIVGVITTEEQLNLHVELKFFTESIPSLTPLLHRINSTLVEEPPLRISDGEIILRGVNQELDEIKELKSSSEAWLLSYQNRLREELGIKNAKVGFTRAFGYYIEVSRNHTEKMPAVFSRRQTLTSGERYISEELLDFEKKILSAEEKIQAKEAAIFQELLINIRAFQEEVLKAAHAIAKIDLLFSLGKMSIERKYVRPKIDMSFHLNIEAGRHPVAEIVHSRPFIANSIQLSAEQKSFALITGPNMGGKSTYIKSVALLVIMAQIGCFIPAAGATIGIVDKIMSRIGASDDLASGQSTFMVEMAETAHILHTKTPRSLILLDEIGRGTSTFDGLSIAWAITENLTFQAPFYPRTLFTTHYHELTKLEESISRIHNMTVAVSESSEGIHFLYKIIPGLANKSYGIHVAQLAGIPSTVVQRAKALLSQLEDPHIKAEKPQLPPIRDDLFIEMQRASENEKKNEKALLFLKSLDLTRLSPIECFMKLVRFQDGLDKGQK